MVNAFFYWIIAALLCVCCEMGTPGLFWFLSFAFGCLLAATLAFVDLHINIQLVGFLAGVLIGFVCLYKYSRKLNQKVVIQTNIAALKGKIGIVIMPIKPEQFGQIKLKGEIWSATAQGGVTILNGELVEVVGSSGCHLIVKINQTK
jgi:membrane protein implicated in regulation of membrane protease activity